MDIYLQPKATFEAMRMTPETIREKDSTPIISYTNPIRDILAIEAKKLPQLTKMAERFIANLIQQAKQEIAPGASVEDKLNMLYSIIYTKNGCTYAPTELLTEGIAQRTIDCDTGAYLFVALGNEIDLPLSIVSVPRHAFIQYTPPHGTPIYYETTRGSLLSQQEYDTYTYHYVLDTNEKIIGSVYALIDDYKSALKLDPQKAEYQANVIIETLNQGGINPQEALHKIDRLLEQDKDPYVYCLSANIYTALQNNAQALAQINKAIAIDPHDFNFYDLRANIYTALQKSDLATQDRLRNNYEQKKLALLYLTNIDQKIEKLTDIITLYQNIVTGEDYTNRATLYAQKNNYTAAMSDLQKAYTYNPNNLNIQKSLCSLASIILDDTFTQKDYEQTVTYCNTLSRMNLPLLSNTLLHYKSASLVYSERYTEALQYIAQGLTTVKLEPIDQAELYYVQAYAYAKTQQFTAANQAIQKAIELNDQEETYLLAAKELEYILAQNSTTE